MATKKKRADLSKAAPESAFDSPFAKLAALKAELPEAAPQLDDDDDDDAAKQELPAKRESRPPKVVVRRERAGRGGKTVTVVEGLALEPAALADLAKDIKRALGCGAVVEGSALVLQGDLDERAATFLEQRQLGRVVLGTRKR